MKIWFIKIGEPLPWETSARPHRYGALSRALASRGHQVTWWTSTFSHAKKVFLREGDCDEIVAGVRVRGLYAPAYHSNISLRRFHHHRYFAKRFLQVAAKDEAPDIIVSAIPTLEASAHALELGKKWGTSVLLDIRDEWPDELVDLSPRPLRWLSRVALSGAFREMERMCRAATGIIGVSRRQLKYGLNFAKREASPMDAVLPLGYSAVRPARESVERAKKVWIERGVRPDHFVCCLFSSINKRCDVRTVVDAARKLEREFPIQFVLCGDGPDLENVRRYAAGVSSVIFTGWVDASEISALMELAQVGLVPLAAQTRMSLNNKPFDYFAGALPVVSSIRGELEEWLQRFECGLTYTPGSSDELCRILRLLHQRPEMGVAMGKRGKDLLEKEFSLEVLSDRFESHLTMVKRLFRETSA